MADSEQTAAPLRHSEVLRVQVRPPEVIPEVIHCSQEKPEVSSVAGGQKTGNVLEDEPCGLKSRNNSQGDERQVAARIIQSEASAGDGERLTGRSEDEDIRPSNSEGAFAEVIGGYVSQIHRQRMALGHDRRRELLDLGVPDPIPLGHGDFWSPDA
ncbi:MAG TPA: hypothetical protein VHL34_24680 [Rhizomicrobium sp.]|nr:hypothetical protein [Rhizomicrobium sp.]